MAVVLAQTNVNQAENPPQAETPPVADESRPTAVTTPTSDAEVSEDSRPLAPEAPGRRARPEPGAVVQPGAVAPVEETVAPAEEALAAEEAQLPPEPARKRWRISPIFSAGVAYDDNIFLSDTNRVGDVIWNVAFGLAFQLGDFRGGSENYLSAQWAGIPTFYTNNSDENRFNQAGTLFAQYRWAKLLAQLNSEFSVATGGNREVNTITTTRSLSNFLRFTYDYSGKTSFDFGFAQSASIVESFQNNYQYEVRGGMSYQMFPKTSLGFEGVGGVLDQPSESLQYYQQGRVRVNYVATGKLNFKLSAGVEAREFQGGGDIKISPVFSLGLDYRPFEGTSISLVGYRNLIGSSSVAGQDIIATGFDITATQRLFQKFTAGISFGFENDEYFSTGTADAESSTDRIDNYFYVRPSLRYSFVRWLSVNIFYEYRNQASNQASSVFYNNRFGMDVAASF